MDDPELERRAGELFDSLDAPPALRRAVDDLVAQHTPTPHRRRARGHTVALIAAAIVATITAAALGVQMIDRGQSTIPAPTTSQQRLSTSPLLRDAGWLFPQAERDYRRAPTPGAIELPGVAHYGQALTQLVRSLIGRGALPVGARVVGPLPRGVIWREASATRPAALDLTAPFGFSLPDGRIALPEVELSTTSAVTDRALRDALRGADPAIPIDALALRIPTLNRCQVQTADGERSECLFAGGNS